MFARHQEWAEAFGDVELSELPRLAAERGDPQLARLAREYLPLCFSRRHGDPSRPWNRFSIEIRDAAGRPLLGYSGNWRDIFQNWEALAISHPASLGAMIAVFLNASTADGYNPYRITRDGIDWEIHDPADPWSHIGYWGDHQTRLPFAAHGEPRAVLAGAARGGARRACLRLCGGALHNRRV